MGMMRVPVLIARSCCSVIDDYVTADVPVRFIDAFVGGLDLKTTGRRWRG